MTRTAYTGGGGGGGGECLPQRTLVLLDGTWRQTRQMLNGAQTRKPGRRPRLWCERGSGERVLEVEGVGGHRGAPSTRVFCYGGRLPSRAHRAPSGCCRACPVAHAANAEVLARCERVQLSATQLRSAFMRSQPKNRCCPADIRTRPLSAIGRGGDRSRTGPAQLSQYLVLLSSHTAELPFRFTPNLGQDVNLG